MQIILALTSVLASSVLVHAQSYGTPTTPNANPPSGNGYGNGNSNVNGANTTPGYGTPGSTCPQVQVGTDASLPLCNQVVPAGCPIPGYGVSTGYGATPGAAGPSAGNSTTPGTNTPAGGNSTTPGTTPPAGTPPTTPPTTPPPSGLGAQSTSAAAPIVQSFGAIALVSSVFALLL